jgi:hypothetical protein
MTRQAQKLSEKLMDESYPLILLIQEIQKLEQEMLLYRTAFELLVTDTASDFSYWRDKAAKEVNNEQNTTD